MKKLNITIHQTHDIGLDGPANVELTHKSKCLDVKTVLVELKGLNFVITKLLGTLYTSKALCPKLVADELVFMNITASSDRRRSRKKLGGLKLRSD